MTNEIIVSEIVMTTTALLALLQESFERMNTLLPVLYNTPKFTITY